MSAPKIAISLGMTSTYRTNDRFRTTMISTEGWHIYTDLDTYAEDIDAQLPALQSFIGNQAALLGATTACHYDISVENVTAPSPYAGSITAPKAHFNGALTAEEFTPNNLYDKLIYVIEQLQEHAKY